MPEKAGTHASFHKVSAQDSRGGSANPRLCENESAAFNFFTNSEVGIQVTEPRW